MKRVALETKSLKLVTDGAHASLYDKDMAGAVLFLDTDQLEQLQDLLNRYRAEVGK